MPQREAADVYGNFGSVPDVTPQGGGGEALRTEANPNDFGAQVQGQVGDTANKFIDMYNDTTARDAAAQASQKLANLEMQYKQNKGLNAVSALKDFQQGASGLTDNMAANMNPAAAQMFRDHFSGEVDQAIFRSGGYAGDELEKAREASYNASMSNLTNGFAANVADPHSDPAGRQQYIQKIQDTALDWSHNKGYDPDTADKLVSQYIGDAYTGGIRSLALTDPDKAIALAQEGKTGAISVNRNGQTISVPYLDAEHQMKISSELNGLFKQQYSDQLNTATNFARSGVPFDEPALSAAMRRAGKPPEEIAAQVDRLHQMGGEAKSSQAAQTVEMTLKDNDVRVANGQPPKLLDPDIVTAAFPKNPEKARAVTILQNNLQDVAGYSAQLPNNSYAKNLEILQTHFAPQTGPEQGPSVPGTHSSAGVSAFNLGNVKTAAGAANNTAEFINPATAADGVMVAAGNLRKNYQGLTLSQIGAKWAPSKENNTSNWVSNVSTASGLSSDTVPDLNDPATMKKLLTGIATAEKKPEDRAAFTSDVLDKGIADALAGKQVNLGAPTSITGASPLAGQSAPPTGPSYSEQLDRYSMAKNVLDTWKNNLDKDPAGTLMSRDNILTGLANKALKDPTQWGTFIDASMAQQKRMEIPEALQSALPQGIAANMVNNITSDPQNGAAAILKLQQQTGAHWPQVWQSLVTQGKLPSYYQDAAALSADPVTANYGQTLLRWSSQDMKGKTDTDLLGPKAIADMRNKIDTDPGVASLKSSLMNSNASKSQVEAKMQSIQSLAFGLQYYNNDPAAAQHAIEAFTSKYDFSLPGSPRVPVQYADAVKNNALVAVNNIQNFRNAPANYTTGYRGRLAPQDYYNDVMSNHTWITSPHEDSIMLMDKQGKFVRDDMNNPVTVPFSLTKTLLPNEKPGDEYKPDITLHTGQI